MSRAVRPVDPDALAAAALSCPDVAGMGTGALGEIATYLPGRRIRGLRLTADGVEVHVVGVYGPSIAQIVEQVTAALTPLVAGQPLSVYVDDLADPAGPLDRFGSTL